MPRRIAFFVSSALACALCTSNFANAAPGKIPASAPVAASAAAAHGSPSEDSKTDAATPGAGTLDSIKPSAVTSGSTGTPGAGPGDTNDAGTPSTAILLTLDGTSTQFETNAPTVGAFLRERGLERAGAFVSPGRNAGLSDGMRITYRSAVPVVLFVGKDKRHVRSSAATVAELLATQHVELAAHDKVRPAPQTPLVADQIVQVTHRRTWTTHVRSRIAPKVTARFDPSLPLGTTRTLVKGRAGYRETTVRVVKSDTGLVKRTVLASRIVRPRPRIVVRGLAIYTSLAHVAAAGFSSVLHFAGSALHVIATAYSAQCDGCSGTTASGVHAGFGIVAVDPSVIPLGTRLFVPGYGRAVAGDTGGAIVGHRVDLGFDSASEAMRFGEHALTIYVLKK